MIVEINGIKLEIDERTARTIDTYKVGDKIKVLVKGYADLYTIYPGVIVGFSEFKSLPSIEIMYVNKDRWEADSIKFGCINSKTTDLEIAPLNDIEVLLDKQEVIDKINRAITMKEGELADMKLKLEFFIHRFSSMFEKATDNKAV